LTPLTIPHSLTICARPLIEKLPFMGTMIHEMWLLDFKYLRLPAGRDFWAMREKPNNVPKASS
jgi:hypothetical protein